jgi:hypothetical protein
LTIRQRIVARRFGLIALVCAIVPRQLSCSSFRQTWSLFDVYDPPGVTYSKLDHSHDARGGNENALVLQPFGSKMRAPKRLKTEHSRTLPHCG